MSSVAEVFDGSKQPLQSVFRQKYLGNLSLIKPYLMDAVLHLHILFEVPFLGIFFLLKDLFQHELAAR